MLKDIDKSDILYINVIRKKNISDIRKKRNRTFDSSLLLSLQLNPSNQQTEPSLVLLILINPVQLPLHEPYFDLTPIKVTHTKTYYRYN